MERIVRLVDDNGDARMRTVSLLQGRGYETEPESGEGFLGRTPGEACVVLKANMQGKEGLEVHDIMILRGLTLLVIFLHGDISLAVKDAIRAHISEFGVVVCKQNPLRSCRT